MLTPDTPGGRDRRSAGPARKRLRTQPATGTVANGTAPEHLSALCRCHSVLQRVRQERLQRVRQDLGLPSQDTTPASACVQT